MSEVALCFPVAVRNRGTGQERGMIDYVHQFFAAAPLAAVALALALGYLFGKLRIGTFVLGPVAATLLVAIAIGQLGVAVSGDVKTLAFALFIYALGYMIGPQFV